MRDHREPVASWTMTGEGDAPIRKSRGKSRKGLPSFPIIKERQQILDHEVAGQVHEGTDNHQREGKPHPQRRRFPRLHRWSPKIRPHPTVNRDRGQGRPRARKIVRTAAYLLAVSPSSASLPRRACPASLSLAFSSTNKLMKANRFGSSSASANNLR